MASETIRILELLRVTGSIYGAALTILAYEAAVNFTQEIDVLWRKKRGITSCTIVLILRWLPIVGMILAWLDNPPSICKFSIMTDQLFYVFAGLAIALFGALRVYSLSLGKIAPSVLVFLLTGVPALSNLVTIIRSTYTFLGPPFDACLQQPIDSPRTISILLWIVSLSSLCGNALILVVTWRFTSQQRRQIGELDVSVPTSTLLLRDGTIYFVIICGMDLIQVVLISLQSKTNTATYIQPFLQVFPPIIICRFILNLKQDHGMADFPEFSSYAGSDSPQSHLQCYVGEMGGSIQWARELDSVEDERGEMSSDIPLDEIHTEYREDFRA